MAHRGPVGQGHRSDGADLVPLAHKEYGRLNIDQVKRLRELEDENARLKKLVADLSLDKAIL